MHTCGPLIFNTTLWQAVELILCLSPLCQSSCFKNAPCRVLAKALSNPSFLYILLAKREIGTAFYWNMCKHESRVYDAKIQMSLKFTTFILQQWLNSLRPPLLSFLSVVFSNSSRDLLKEIQRLFFGCCWLPISLKIIRHCFTGSEEANPGLRV